MNVVSFCSICGKVVYEKYPSSSITGCCCLQQISNLKQEDRMSFLKKIYNDIMDRVFGNPKSSIAGALALIGYLAGVYGFDIPPEILAAISSILLASIGLLKKD